MSNKHPLRETGGWRWDPAGGETRAHSQSAYTQSTHTSTVHHSHTVGSHNPLLSVCSEQTGVFVCRKESQSNSCLLSALDPGHHVVEQEEDQDHAYRHVTENAAVVTAGTDHGGETLDAATQQAGGTQKVGVLAVGVAREIGSEDRGKRRRSSIGLVGEQVSHHVVQIVILVLSLSVNVIRQLTHEETQTQVHHYKK